MGYFQYHVCVTVAAATSLCPSPTQTRPSAATRFSASQYSQELLVMEMLVYGTDTRPSVVRTMALRVR